MENKIFNNIKKISLICMICLGVLFTSPSYSYQLPVNKGLWDQNHLQSDGRGGYYNQKPGTSLWESEHIIPDSRGGFYVHKPGSTLWNDQHITSDGRGGFYY